LYDTFFLLIESFDAMAAPVVSSLCIDI